jgi:hypothetical protein
MTEAGLKLPVGLSETTAIPTVVRPSDSVKMFLWNNENLVEADRAVLEEFLRLTRDNVGPILKMYLRTHDEVVLNVPMHRAFRDLEFVDLPGLLGSDRTLEEKAFLHALASDGVVYVVDAQQGITKTDREFIAKIVKEGLRILLVGTHMDLVKSSEHQKVLNAIRENLRPWEGSVEDILAVALTDEQQLDVGSFMMFVRFLDRQDPVECLQRNFGQLMAELQEASENNSLDQTGQGLVWQAVSLRHRLTPDQALWEVRVETESKKFSSVSLSPSDPGRWIVSLYSDETQNGEAEEPEETWEINVGLFPARYDIEAADLGLHRAAFAFAIMVHGTYKGAPIYASSKTKVHLKNADWLRCGYSGPGDTLIAWTQTEDRSFLQAWRIAEISPLRKKRDVKAPFATDALSDIEYCDDIVSYGTPSWGTAVKIGGRWYVVVNGAIVGGAYNDASSPVLSPDGKWWAARVAPIGGGEAIAYGQCASATNTKQYPTQFDLVSHPCFLSDGRILFAALRGERLGLYLIEEL